MKVLYILFCSAVGAALTALIVWSLKKYAEAFEAKFPLVAILSGFIENLIYLISILALRPEFIFVWLGVKTAAVWYRKGKKKDFNDIQRNAYHSYLLGTGLNILLAYASACLIEGKLIFISK